MIYVLRFLIYDIIDTTAHVLDFSGLDKPKLIYDLRFLIYDIIDKSKHFLNIYNFL